MYRPQRATRRAASIWQRQAAAAAASQYDKESDETDYSDEYELDEKAFSELYDPEHVFFKVSD